MFFKSVVLLATISMISSCQLGSSHDDSDTTNTNTQSYQSGKIDPKYSIAADREALSDLRSQIPEDKKVQNDEKALYAQWMSDYKYSPDQVRDKFNNIVRKKRDLFNKDIDKSRESFSKNEKKSRDESMEKLKDEREEFLARTKDTMKRHEFTNDQNTVS